jgi:hypothetical protein
MFSDKLGIDGVAAASLLRLARRLDVSVTVNVFEAELDPCVATTD